MENWSEIKHDIVLINTKYKALRCSYRHFARTPIRTSRPVAKHSLSWTPNSETLQKGEHVFLSDKTLPEDRNTSCLQAGSCHTGNLLASWPVTPLTCKVLIQNRISSKMSKLSVSAGKCSFDSQTSREWRLGVKTSLSFLSSWVPYVVGLVVQLTGCICIERKSNAGVSIGIITYYRESSCRWLANITKCCDWLGLRSAKEWSRMSTCEFIHVNVQRKMDWYHQLFSLGEGKKTGTCLPPPTLLLLHFSISLPLLPFYSQHKNTLTSPQEGQAEWEQRFWAHIML